MHIKIEIDCKPVSLREYVAKTIAKEIVKKVLKEKQERYREEPIIHELENASTVRLIKCWLKNVWPLPQLYLLQGWLSRQH